MNLGPIVLDGSRVRLEPIRSEHAGGLWLAATASEIWTWMSDDLSDRQILERWLDQAVAEERVGTAYVFAVIDKTSHSVVGSTRYLDIQPREQGVEIGWTWYTPKVWSTTVNPETKLLLLRHAFEDWGAIRVALKTDDRNVRSQAAIRKLGAQYEGTLRNHRIRSDGSIRHTIMFSIISDEWPAVRNRLMQRIAEGSASP